MATVTSVASMSGSPELVVPAPVEPVPAALGPDQLVAFAVTFLVVTIFYAVTLHLAVLWVLGDAPHQRAVMVAPVIALVSMLLQRYGAPVTIPVTFVSDLLLISVVYGLRVRTAIVLAVFHFAIAVIVGLAVLGLFGVV